MRNYLQKNFKIKLVYYTLTIILFIILEVFAIPSVRASWALATTVKPETYTELYFENQLNLPSIVKANQQYYFDFTIHNLENQNMTYPYEVYLQTGDVKLPIDRNTVTIKNSQYKTVQEGFSINVPFIKSEIVVNLINKNQQIDFWFKNIRLPLTKIAKKQIKTIITYKIPSPTPTIFFLRPTVPVASASAVSKKYGGWYMHGNKIMVWLGKDSNNQDIWSITLPK
jgi:hypothetical protein